MDTQSGVIKAVVFDIDGTLTTSIAWPHFTGRVGGTLAANDEAFRSFVAHEIDEQELNLRLLKNWTSTTNHKDFFIEVLNEIELRSDAKEAVDYLRSKGYVVCLITGSFDLYARLIAKRIDVDEWYANTNFIFDNKRQMIEVQTIVDDSGRKIEHFTAFCTKHGLKPNECVAVGDSANDMGLFITTGKGIMLHTEYEAPELEKVAWKTITALKELKEIL